MYTLTRFTRTPEALLSVLLSAEKHLFRKYKILLTKILLYFVYITPCIYFQLSKSALSIATPRMYVAHVGSGLDFATTMFWAVFTLKPIQVHYYRRVYIISVPSYHAACFRAVHAGRVLTVRLCRQSSTRNKVCTYLCRAKTFVFTVIVCTVWAGRLPCIAAAQSNGGPVCLLCVVRR